MYQLQRVKKMKALRPVVSAGTLEHLRACSGKTLDSIGKFHFSRAPLGTIWRLTTLVSCRKKTSIEQNFGRMSAPVESHGRLTIPWAKRLSASDALYPASLRISAPLLPV